VTERADVVVVGAGAAGLMAAIWARRTDPTRHVVAVDGARTLGAKILVAGGGRCNVTHHAVDETAFAGSTRPAIRKVLRRFGVDATVAFFRDEGVALKREDTGKLFPVTDRARTVLDALLRAADAAGVEVRHPWRVARVAPGFVVTARDGAAIAADRVVLATGGQALPKTGSDGAGYELARALGHTVTRTFPALVPLRLPDGHFLRTLSGLSAPATLTVRAGGRRVAEFTGPVLCTHFGLSGPAALDVSRYWTDARRGDAGAALVASWLPGTTAEALDAALRDPARTPGRLLADLLPDRLARALCAEAGDVWAVPGRRLTREARQALVRAVVELRLPVTGDRGFTEAEATAGGVPLAELRLDTLESRVTPGLYVCGELCDVDGRIGGFNFQWAWSSGFVAGTAAARAPTREPSS
jgi:predicted Rossmann fold flavoprotein